MSPLAVTMGEPAGIGAELAVKAWHRRRRDHLPPFFVIGDAGQIARNAAAANMAAEILVIEDLSGLAGKFAAALPVLHRPLPAPATPGQPDPAAAPLVIDWIREGVAHVRSAAAAGLVTLPIHKQSLVENGFGFPGHTEFLADLCGTPGQQEMLLVSKQLRVLPATLHQSLAEAIASLTTDRLVEAGRRLAAALCRDFGIEAPRLAVAGLNPHAGEGGLLGREEIDIIAPAVKALAGAGIDITGPLPADTLFHDRARAGYDAALCLYHDQALIPLKTLDFDGGVNVTIGLEIVRSSPDHGTGFDLAGTGRARPDSFIAALQTASAIAARRCA